MARGKLFSKHKIEPEIADLDRHIPQFEALETALSRIGFTLKAWQNDPTLLPVRTAVIGRRRVVRIADVNHYLESKLEGEHEK